MGVIGWLKISSPYRRHIMPTLADVFVNHGAYDSVFAAASEAEITMLSKRHNEVLLAVAKEHGMGSHADAYSLPDSTELGEKSLPVFEGLCRDLEALREKYRGQRG